MHSLSRIATAVHTVHCGPAWHGPSLRDVLEDVNAQQAAERPFSNAHNIWELVAHLTAWLEFTRRRLEGESFDVTLRMDWPDMPEPSEEAWQATLEALWTAETRFHDVTVRIDESRADDPFEGDFPTALYLAIDGVGAHAAYHGGQIALLKKLVQGPA